MNSFVALVVLLVATPGIFAQTAALSGRVLDESGAIVPAAKVTLEGAQGFAKTAITGGDGAYTFTGLPPGDYSIAASAPQLVTPGSATVTLHPGAQSLNLELRIATTAAEVTVSTDAGPALGTAASSNASATVLTGNDLESLSDNPDDLQADLEALAGPAAGTDGNEIFIDGFSGGQLPPKESIREVRLNQNPFCARIRQDRPGPHRNLYRSPVPTNTTPPSLTTSGPTGGTREIPMPCRKLLFCFRKRKTASAARFNKRTSFTLDLERQAIENGSVSNGVTLDPANARHYAFHERFPEPATGNHNPAASLFPPELKQLSLCSVTRLRA